MKKDERIRRQKQLERNVVPKTGQRIKIHELTSSYYTDYSYKVSKYRSGSKNFRGVHDSEESEKNFTPLYRGKLSAKMYDKSIDPNHRSFSFGDWIPSLDVIVEMCMPKILEGGSYWRLYNVTLEDSKKIKGVNEWIKKVVDRSKKFYASDWVKGIEGLEANGCCICGTVLNEEYDESICDECSPHDFEGSKEIARMIESIEMTMFAVARYVLARKKLGRKVIYYKSAGLVLKACLDDYTRKFPCNDRRLRDLTDDDYYTIFIERVIKNLITNHLHLGGTYLQGDEFHAYVRLKVVNCICNYKGYLRQSFEEWDGDEEDEPMEYSINLPSNISRVIDKLYDRVMKEYGGGFRKYKRIKPRMLKDRKEVLEEIEEHPARVFIYTESRHERDKHRASTCYD